MTMGNGGYGNENPVDILMLESSCFSHDKLEFKSWLGHLAVHVTLDYSNSASLWCCCKPSVTALCLLILLSTDAWPWDLHCLIALPVREEAPSQYH